MEAGDDAAKAHEGQKRCVTCAQVKAPAEFERGRLECRKCKNRKRRPGATKREPKVTGGLSLCPRCERRLPATVEFFNVRRHRGSDQLQSWCRKCMVEYAKTPERKSRHSLYMQENREVLSENRKRWRRENPVRAAWLGLKSRAERITGVSFSLTWERFQVLMASEKCPVCGVKMKDKGRHGRHDMDMKSVDRILAGGDYSNDNCACICKRCNAVKNDGSADEHERIAAWIRSVSG